MLFSRHLNTVRLKRTSDFRDVKEKMTTMKIKAGQYSSANYLDRDSLKDSSPVGAHIIEANDAAAAGCCVVSTI